MATAKTVFETEIEGLPLFHRGKVRDIYQVNDDQLLFVATDRLSAFDCVLPTPIEHKGAVLTAMSAFWFRKLAHIVDHHMITADFDEMPAAVRRHEELRGRSMLVKRTKVFPVECVVRGYLEGSGWKDYKATKGVCGHDLPPGLKQCDKLLTPIFTPATKAEVGHDDNITQVEFMKIVGLIIADTNFEFGEDKDGNILLVDEVLTPDSSRFWNAESWEPGHPQPSFDKQFVREYLETLDWDKRPPAPALPPDVARATTERYLEAYRRLTGREL
jgi:phosphoribosylaminoimidazole-succinocarboxamide synthase